MFFSASNEAGGIDVRLVGITEAGERSICVVQACAGSILCLMPACNCLETSEAYMSGKRHMILKESKDLSAGTGAQIT